MGKGAAFKATPSCISGLQRIQDEANERTFTRFSAFAS
jgi:hypothetical protein